MTDQDEVDVLFPDSEETEVPRETPEEVPEEEPKEEPPTPETVPKPAYLEERRRRQEAEKRAKELEAQIPKTENEPDPYDDPDGYRDYLINKGKQEAQAEETAKVQQRIEESRNKALEEYDDYLKKEKIFRLMMLEDDSLKDKVFQSDNPAKFAYQTATAYLEDLYGKPETQGVEEIIEEKSLPKVPNLATANSKGNNYVEPEKDDEDFMDMFNEDA